MRPEKYSDFSKVTQQGVLCQIGTRGWHPILCVWSDQELKRKVSVVWACGSVYISVHLYISGFVSLYLSVCLSDICRSEDRQSAVTVTTLQVSPHSCNVFQSLSPWHTPPQGCEPDH